MTSCKNVLGSDQKNDAIVKTYSLPEGEENDQLDRQHLQERLVLGQIGLHLNVELDQAEHGDCDRGTFETRDPDVSEGRTQAVLAIAAENLRDDRDDRE